MRCTSTMVTRSLCSPLTLVFLLHPSPSLLAPSLALDELLDTMITDAGPSRERGQLRLFSSSSASAPRVCTIAGSDSGGGAGIQADLKTFAALGAYGLSVVTALTAQNTTGVQGIHVPPADFVTQQMKSVKGDIRIDAWKIGMLANEDVVRAVAQSLRPLHGQGE